MTSRASSHTTRPQQAALSSLPFPNIQHAQNHTHTPTPNPRADHIVHKFFNKATLVIHNARLTTDGPDSQDTANSLSSSTGATQPPGTSSASSSVVLGIAGAPQPVPQPAGGGGGARPRTGPKVDRWFNLETPDSDVFKSTLHIYKSISTTFPIAPTSIALPTPPLNINILLSIPQTVHNQVLVLSHSNHRTRIDPKPKYILLESWRVALTRPPTTGSTTSSISSSSTSSLSEVELPTVYKQSIALFRSMYTLLRILPAGKLQKRLRKRTRTGFGGGLALEIKVDVEEEDYDDDSSGDEQRKRDQTRLGIVGFDSPLSQDQQVDSTDSFSFPHIASPLGYLNVSVKYRTQANFSLDSLESLLSSGFFTADQRQNNIYVPTEPQPNYPRPPYPPVAGAPTREEAEKERRLRGPSLNEAEQERELRRREELEREEREFEVVGGFTPTVVVEEQRRRKESVPNGVSATSGQAGAAGQSTRAPLSASPLSSVPIRTALPRSPPMTTIGLSNRVHPASLPRERTITQPGTSYGSDRDRSSPSTSAYGSAYGSATAAGAPTAGPSLQTPQLQRSRFNSIPHSSSPLSTQTSSYRNQLAAQQQLASLNETTPSRKSTVTPASPPTMHARTISMPSSASRNYTGLPGGMTTGLPGTPTIGGRFAFAARTDDLAFASSAASRSGVTAGGTVRRRQDSTGMGNSSHSGTGLAGDRSSSSLFSGSAPGASAASPIRSSFAPPFSPGATGSFKDAMSPSATGPSSLPMGRKPSITIHPFKSATLSSSPAAHSSFPHASSLRQQSPLSERAPGGFGLPSTVQAPFVGSHPSRSPLQQGVNPPAQYGSLSPSSTPSERDKRASVGSLEGAAGAMGRRLTYSPENPGVGGIRIPGAGGTGTAPAMKRYSSSFSHRYAANAGTPPGPGLTVGAMAAGGQVVGSAGSGGSGGRGVLGLAGIPGRAEEKSFLSTATDDDDIGAYVRAIDDRPQLRGGTTRRMSGSGWSESPIPAAKVLSDISESRTSEVPSSIATGLHTREGTGATGSSSVPFVSALESVETEIDPESRQGTIHESGEPSTAATASDASHGVGRAVMLTSRADVDEKLRKMKEDFERGMDKVTETRRQQQERRDVSGSDLGAESDGVTGSTSTGVAGGLQASPHLGGSSSSQPFRGGSPRARVYRMMERERTDSQSSFGAGSSSGITRKPGSTGTFEEAFGRME